MSKAVKNNPIAQIINPIANFGVQAASSAAQEVDKQLKGSDLARIGNEAKQFGRDITGATAREAADRTIAFQQEQQTILERNLATQDLREKNALEFKSKRRDQKQAALKAANQPVSSMPTSGLKTVLGG